MVLKPIVKIICFSLTIVAFNANAYMIDSFDNAAGPITIGGLTDVITDDSAIFTTQRDFGVSSISNLSSTTAEISGGALTSNGGRPPGGVVILDYDGDESLLTCTGGVPCEPSAFLNAFEGASGVFDLTDGGINNAFRLSFSQMAGPFTIEIDWSLIDSGVLFSTAATTNPGTPLQYSFSGTTTSLTHIIFPFTEITDQLPAAIDLTQVGWLRFTFGMSAGSSFVLDSIDTTVVPIPAAVWLFGSGLLGMIGIARRKKAA